LLESRYVRLLLDYSAIVVGAVICGAALAFFLLPNDIVAGGVTGLAILISHFTSLSTGAALVLLNVPILVLARLAGAGRRLFLRTAVGVAVLSVATDLLLSLGWVPTRDRLLLVFYGGLISGAGLGLVFLGRGTTGGLDVLARLAQRWFGVGVGQTILAVNVVVFGLAALVFGFEAAAVALLLSFVMSRSLDAVLHGVSSTRTAFIVTDRPLPVKEAILNHLGRGLTEFKGRGGYSGRPRTMLMVVVGRSDTRRLKFRVSQADPDAFVTIYTPREVQGGFLLPQQDQEL